MDALELEKKIKLLVNQTNHDEFIYELLELYGTAKSTLTRLKKGNDKLSKKENQLIVKKKLFFEKASKSDNLLSLINSLDKDSKSSMALYKSQYLRWVRRKHRVKKSSNFPVFSLLFGNDVC